MATLTSDHIGKQIRDAIRDSTEIYNYSNLILGTVHSVYYGSTGTKAPPVEDMPAFAVIPWAKERGEDDADRVFTYTIILSLEDTAFDQTQTGGGVKYKTYRGPKTLEDLLDLSMTAIRAISNEIYFDDKTTDYEPIEYFPLFVGELVLTVTVPILIGGYEPDLSDN